MHWMREIIQKHQLDLGLPDVETSGADRKMPDVVLCESRRSQQVLCLFEAKLPYFNVFDEEELKEPARRKATERRAKYFVTLNFKRLIWYKTEAVNAIKPEEEQTVEIYSLSEIENLDDLEAARYSEPIKRKLEEFLLKLYKVHTGAEPEPKKAIDELLISRLQEKIERLSRYYRQTIEEQAHKDAEFALALHKWFADQNWEFSRSPADFDKAARQTSYLLVNKILFYDMLQARRPGELDPLDIPASLTKGSRLQATLQSHFSEALKIDYETIFTTDFIDSIAFPDAPEVVKEIKELVAALNGYNFLQIGFDVIGRIFERLIPEKERHYFGQYFTNADVVDLILRFCLKHEDEKVLDPSCGAGTFLVRAYQHKKLMNQRKPHEEILETLWGNDIAKFPAHLATINLAINDLSRDRNYPNILHKDFFELRVDRYGFAPEGWRKGRAKSLGVAEQDLTYPRHFDCIVGNPPYTKQEEISKIAPEDAEYKDKLIEGALHFNKERLADISRRAGLHAYFFVHGTKFLHEGGRFGFVVPSAWLDTDYGKGLQEFFLQHYKIIAIIESKVERWFEEADVNTCVVLLEKCSDEQARNEHPARFVYLKKPLRHFIPPAQDLWEKQTERLRAIDDLRRTILAHADIYENDELCIFPKLQKELWAEGYDDEKARYVGARWGKYLRAPEIFFRIMEKGKNKFVPLRDVATVRFGIKTGANEFFHLTKEKAADLEIEQEFLQPVIFSLKEVKGYRLKAEELTRRIIICHKANDELEGTRLLSYIKEGEKRDYHERPTCASRGRDSWYMLGKNWHYAPLIFPAKVGERMPVFLNDEVFEDKKLYGITPKNSGDTLVLAGLLNSTLSRFFIEFSARQLTGSQAIADIDVVVVEELLIPYVRKALSAKIKKQIEKAFESLAQTPAESVFKEIAPVSSEVSLNEIKAERRELDRIIMSDVLGLSEDEQLAVYRAVVDLVRTRLDKAKSVGKRAKLKGGVDIERLKMALIEEYENGE
jgi:type I restriction-modification system DNA methylase subunit